MTTPASDRPEARPGPGRPPGPLGRTRRVEVRIPGPVLDRLDDEAARRGISRSRALVQAILDWLGGDD